MGMLMHRHEEYRKSFEYLPNSEGEKYEPSTTHEPPVAEEEKADEAKPEPKRSRAKKSETETPAE